MLAGPGSCSGSARWGWLWVPKLLGLTASAVANTGQLPPCGGTLPCWQAEYSLEKMFSPQRHMHSHITTVQTYPSQAIETKGHESQKQPQIFCTVRWQEPPVAVGGECEQIICTSLQKLFFCLAFCWCSGLCRYLMGFAETCSQL